MESQHQKWVNVSFLAVSLLLGFIVFTFGAKLIGIYDLETRIKYADPFLRGLSVLLGGILFFILYRHDQANQFMNEVMVELSRVSWPTQKETSSATILVIIMVLISGTILGFLDYLWTMLIKQVL